MIALKANQKYLYEEIENWFKLGKYQELKPKEYSYDQQIEAGHHRIEKREVWAIPVSKLPCLHNQSLWAGLTTVVIVKSDAARSWGFPP